MNINQAMIEGFEQGLEVEVESGYRWKTAETFVDLRETGFGDLSVSRMRSHLGASSADGEPIEYRVQQVRSERNYHELLFRVDGVIYYALLMRSRGLGYALLRPNQTIWVLSRRYRLAKRLFDACWFAEVRCSEEACEWLGCEPPRPPPWRR